ncbi:class I SAM-dependent methyltransferase [Cytobacillus gottheilii]|uniref:class I SAM-dependent methyltransferase n=1 Tax=Cytobacillus gottheilii TaxID=859144 RepID=UPI0009BB7397|nr:class I SAM-dependent methyltransferase [Cytobacillus gottheilii]
MKKWSEESEKQWNRRSSTWHASSKTMWEEGSRKDIIPFFCESVPEFSKVCDLGCGDGFGSLKLAEKGYEVTGYDVSEEMIHRAKETNKQNHAQFIKGDITELQLPENSYDAVIAINSLEWTEDPLRVLMHIKHMVKRGGYACVGVLGPTAGPRNSSFRRLYGDQVICNTMMPWEFEALAQENGWEKAAELPVYKKAADQVPKGSLPVELKQALSFMWVFMLKNRKEEEIENEQIFD